MSASLKAGRRAPWKRIDEVEYLVFEGGGGQGYAYFGALVALADMGYLLPIRRTEGIDYVLDPTKTRGVAGSSAGAITALSLVSGIGIRRTHRALTMRVGDDPVIDVLDSEPWGVNKRSASGGCYVVQIEDPHGDLWNLPEALIPLFELIEQYLSSEGVSVPEDLPARTNLLNELGKRFGERLLAQNDETLPRSLVKRILGGENLASYLRNLRRDYGLFSGCNIDVLLMWMALSRGTAGLSTVRQETIERFEAGVKTGKIIPLTPDPKRDVLFGESRESSGGINLVVVGSDLRTGAWRYFSGEQTHTPESADKQMSPTPVFGVASATRLSMSIPGIFKPVVDPLDITGNRVKGVWVDGGLLNNYPIRAFNTRPGQSVHDNVLGFRLESAMPGKIDGFWDFVGAKLMSQGRMSSESQITSAKAEARTVVLPTEGLSVTEFDPDPEVVTRAMITSAAVVYEYFGVESTSTAARERAEANVDAFLNENDPLPGPVTVDG